MIHARGRVYLSTIAGGPSSGGPSSRSNGQRDDAEVRHRVLVVGTDEPLLGFVTRALDAFRPGFEVATARTPEEARNWMETFRPEVIILDGDLAAAAEPGSDRWLETMASTSVLLLGAEQQDQLPGATILTKPLRLPSLLSAMREVAW